jgi:hypothetical protein
MTDRSPRWRRWLGVLFAGLGLAAGACGSGGTVTHPASSEQAIDQGLSASAEGFSLDSPLATIQPGDARSYNFRILGPGGGPQTDFVESQTKLLHLYAVRADLAEFNHIHPALAPNGTWTTTPEEPLRVLPGPYRVYAQFEAKDSQGSVHTLVLSRPLVVAGAYQAVPLPAASTTSDADGYSLTVEPPGPGEKMRIHFTQGGQPVNNLETYLGVYAHLTAFRVGTMGFAHLHPIDQVDPSRGGGGPDLTFHAPLPPGDYRMFVQFQTAGRLHTAALTLHI